MAAFLARALYLPAGPSTDFVDDNDSIFESDIEKLAAAGITAGCNPPDNDRFCPDNHVTRGRWLPSSPEPSISSGLRSRPTPLDRFERN